MITDYLIDLFLFFLLLFFFLFLFFFFFRIVVSGGSLGTGLLILIRGLWVASLFAGPLAEPLGQLGLGALQPFIVFLLPEGLEVFCSDNFPTSFVKLPSVFIGSGVSPTLIFGVHANIGWVFTSKSLRIKTLLHGLLPQLLFLSLLELFKVVVLPLLSFLKIVFLGLKSDNGIPKLLGLAGKLVGVHGIDIEGFDSDGEGDFLLFLQLFFGLGHLSACVLDVSTALHFGSTTLAACSLLFFFLSLHHGLSLHFCFFEAFLFLFSFLGLLFGLFLAEPLLLFLLLLGQFFLLLGSDLLALGLFFLEPLQFFLLFATLFAPFVDVFPQLFVEFTLLFLSLEESLTLFGGLGGDLLLLIIFFIRHGANLSPKQ